MLLYYLKRQINKYKWRKQNKNNFTRYNNIFGDMKKIHIGNFTYGDIYVSSPNNNYELNIGNFCSIGGNVKFLLGVDHVTNLISTYPFHSNILHNGIDAISKGDILIDDDVWIGENAIILSGVHIGQGAVVAAGSVVTKDVPPYAIVGGVPVKVIKYRFNQGLIKELLKIDYSKLTEKQIQEHINDLYSLDVETNLSWIPKH